MVTLLFNFYAFLVRLGECRSCCGGSVHLQYWRFKKHYCWGRASNCLHGGKLKFFLRFIRDVFSLYSLYLNNLVGFGIFVVFSFIDFILNNIKYLL